MSDPFQRNLPILFVRHGHVAGKVGRRLVLDTEGRDLKRRHNAGQHLSIALIDADHFRR